MPWLRPRRALVARQVRRRLDSASSFKGDKVDPSDYINYVLLNSQDPLDVGQAGGQAVEQPAEASAVDPIVMAAVDDVQQ